MAVGKSGVNVNIKKLSISIGPNLVFKNGNLNQDYDEMKALDYMKNETIEITVNIGTGKKRFTAYTMDLTNKYIEINADYRS